MWKCAKKWKCVKVSRCAKVRRSGSVENVTFDFRGKLEFQQLKSDWGVDKQVKSRLRLYLVGWVEEPRYSFDERQLR